MLRTHIDMQREDIYIICLHRCIYAYIHICASSSVCICGVQEKLYRTTDSDSSLYIKESLQPELASMFGKDLKLYNVCRAKVQRDISVVTPNRKTDSYRKAIVERTQLMHYIYSSESVYIYLHIYSQI